MGHAVAAASYINYIDRSLLVEFCSCIPKTFQPQTLIPSEIESDNTESYISDHWSIDKAFRS